MAAVGCCIIQRTIPEHERLATCGQPVYFVQEDWYNTVYVPRYREGKHHGQGQDKKRGKGKGHRED